MFDTNGDHQISARELSSVIRKAIGPHHLMSEVELQQLIQDADLLNNGTSGTLTFDEFLTLMQNRLKEVNVQDEIIEAFRIFDRERTGFVSIDDMKKVLMKMGDGELAKEEINDILRDIDPEGLQAFKYEVYVRNNFDFFNSPANNSDLL